MEVRFGRREDELCLKGPLRSRLDRGKVVLLVDSFDRNPTTKTVLLLSTGPQRRMLRGLQEDSSPTPESDLQTS